MWTRTYVDILQWWFCLTHFGACSRFIWEVAKHHRWVIYWDPKLGIMQNRGLSLSWNHTLISGQVSQRANIWNKRTFPTWRRNSKGQRCSRHSRFHEHLQPFLKIFENFARQTPEEERSVLHMSENRSNPANFVLSSHSGTTTVACGLFKVDD